MVFLIAALGGLNSVTGGVLYTSIATFAAGGASPWLLGLVAGVGITIGDIIMFTLLRTGVKSLNERAQPYRIGSIGYVPSLIGFG